MLQQGERVASLCVWAKCLSQSARSLAEEGGWQDRWSRHGNKRRAIDYCSLEKGNALNGKKRPTRANTAATTAQELYAVNHC